MAVPISDALLISPPYRNPPHFKSLAKLSNLCKSRTSYPHVLWDKTNYSLNMLQRPIHLWSILTLSLHQRLCLPSGLFSSGFLTKTLYVFFFFPILATYYGHLTLLDTVTRITLSAYNHKAPYYEISSCLHLLPPSLVCISSSVPCSSTSSAYVRPVTLHQQTIKLIPKSQKPFRWEI